MYINVLSIYEYCMCAYICIYMCNMYTYIQVCYSFASFLVSFYYTCVAYFLDHLHLRDGNEAGRHGPRVWAQHLPSQCLPISIPTPRGVTKANWQYIFIFIDIQYTYMYIYIYMYTYGYIYIHIYIYVYLFHVNNVHPYIYVYMYMICFPYYI